MFRNNMSILFQKIKYFLLDLGAVLKFVQRDNGKVFRKT